MKYFKNVDTFMNELKSDTYSNAAKKAQRVGDPRQSKFDDQAKKEKEKEYYDNLLKQSSSLEENAEKYTFSGREKDIYYDFDNMKIYSSAINNSSATKEDMPNINYIIDLPYYSAGKWSNEPNVFRCIVGLKIDDKIFKTIADSYWKIEEDIVDYDIMKVSNFKRGLIDKDIIPFKLSNGVKIDINNVKDFINTNNGVIWSYYNKVVTGETLSILKKEFPRFNKIFKEKISKTINPTDLKERLLNDFFAKNNLKHLVENLIIKTLKEEVKGDKETEFITYWNPELDESHTYEVLKDVDQNKLYKLFLKRLKKPIDNKWYKDKGYTSKYDHIKKEFFRILTNDDDYDTIEDMIGTDHFSDLKYDYELPYYVAMTLMEDYFGYDIESVTGYYEEFEYGMEDMAGGFNNFLGNFLRKLFKGQSFKTKKCTYETETFLEDEGISIVRFDCVGVENHGYKQSKGWLVKHDGFGESYEFEDDERLFDILVNAFEYEKPDAQYIMDKIDR